MGNQEICFGHVLKPWVAISSQFLSITAGIDELLHQKSSTWFYFKQQKQNQLKSSKAHNNIELLKEPTSLDLGILSIFS